MKSLIAMVGCVLCLAAPVKKVSAGIANGYQQSTFHLKPGQTAAWSILYKKGTTASITLTQSQPQRDTLLLSVSDANGAEVVGAGSDGIVLTLDWKPAATQSYKVTLVNVGRTEADLVAAFTRN